MGKKRRLEIVIEKGEWTWRVRPELAWRMDAIEKALLDAAAGKESEAVKVTGGRRTIWSMRLGWPDCERGFIKHYSRPRFSKQLKHLFRRSRTLQEWTMGRRLEEMGLPVAKHLAMGQRKKAGLLAEEILLQEELRGYENFDAWFKQRHEGSVRGPATRERRDAIGRLALLARSMHDRRVLQRDFKPDSIMVGPGGDYRLVDLERALVSRGFGGLGRTARVRNLAKMDQTFGRIGSMTDRLRFLKAYIGPKKWDREKALAMIGEIGREAEIEWRKKAREVRVWARTRNESYRSYRYRGHEVNAYFMLHREFMEDFIDNIGEALTREHRCVWGPGQAEHAVAARWGDSLAALECTAGLYYRKPPFVPARASVRPMGGQWGLILQARPEPPLPGWAEAAETARRDGREAEFAEELGRTMRVYRRMGFDFKTLRPDTFLYNASQANHMHRFQVYRIDDLVLNRDLAPAEARARLAEAADLLDLSGPARDALEASYRRCLSRWFKAPDFY